MAVGGQKGGGSKGGKKAGKKKTIPDSIAQDARKAASWIYPQADTIIRKVKVLKKPKMDLARLMELHGESKDSAPGEGVIRPDHYEPPQVDSV
ncbi:small subunit ribosomal protein S3Ae [Paragonimus westermani]|uniref:Small subunit ribosomal protein S3Ae n=1 Tax=Paragonimus westermani TaxID=34504 RepID=A0A5J4NWA8_9TREM|nr:small subunit ribosomal protein S3Ae [Paragonimus westermani]